MLYDDEIVSDVPFSLNIVVLHAKIRDASAKPSEQFTFGHGTVGISSKRFEITRSQVVSRFRVMRRFKDQITERFGAENLSNDHIKYSSIENTVSSPGGAMDGFLASLNKEAIRTQLTTQ